MGGILSLSKVATDSTNTLLKRDVLLLQDIQMKIYLSAPLKVF